MRKKAFLLMLVLFLGIFLVACNSDGEGDSEDQDDTNSEDQEQDDEEASNDEESSLSGEITVWAHPFTGEGDAEQEMWDEITTSYEEEYGVTVNFEQIPWSNRDQKILTALAANNGPDVFYAIPDQMPQYADEGMLLELDPYLEDHDMDDFVESSLVSVQWQDKTYGLPILQEAYTLFYNLDVVRDIGEDPDNLPETWEEFEEWAVKAKENDYYATAFSFGGSMNGTLYPYIWQAGGEILTQDDEVKINDEKSVEAFEYVNKLYEDGHVPEDSITAQEHNEMWDSGQIMASMGSGINLQILQEKDEIDFGIAPPMKNEQQQTYGTTGMFVVPSNTENPDAAAEFVKHMTNSENQRKFNSVTKYIPTRESAKDIFDDQPYLSQLASYTQYALPGVIHPAGRSIMPFIQAELQAMLEGEKSPQEAADAAAERIANEIN
ncbi:sugar ABC transporter substrate-binding protein [Aquisalibacillus elongatus]|uniref:Multiple sugar transport system substrate-binding protein n=1 Tax=Aquisalibacillus elongatus TaxID=485577 RepID=A0A3N5BA42_9BACI|nr:sugar ABC transporter substrate-binding protein [Aquisalibacillus elongatus]RPF54273.1 multiple sugar transport system substrate-binding protein [Aquisalibacillus elongatus]